MVDEFDELAAHLRETPQREYLGECIANALREHAIRTGRVGVNGDPLGVGDEVLELDSKVTGFWDDTSGEPLDLRWSERPGPTR